MMGEMNLQHQLKGGEGIRKKMTEDFNYDFMFFGF